MRVGPRALQTGADRVVGNRVGNDERATDGAGAEELILHPEFGRGDVATLQPDLCVRVAAAGDARGGRAQIVGGEGKPQPRRKAALEIALVSREVPIAPGNTDARSRCETIVLSREEGDSEQTGPALDFDPVEKADREERRIDRDAVDTRGHVGQAVEIVLGRCRAASLKAHRLRPAGEPSPPEIDPGDLAEQVSHGRRVAPFDRVAVEDDPGERRARPLYAKRRQNRRADALFLLRLEEFRGVVDGVAGERVGLERVVGNLCLSSGKRRKEKGERRKEYKGCHPERSERSLETSLVSRFTVHRSPFPRPITNSVNSRTPMPVGPFTRVASSRSV